MAHMVYHRCSTIQSPGFFFSSKGKIIKRGKQKDGRD